MIILLHCSATNTDIYAVAKKCGDLLILREFPRSQNSKLQVWFVDVGTILVFPHNPWLVFWGWYEHLVVGMRPFVSFLNNNLYILLPFILLKNNPDLSRSKILLLIFYSFGFFDKVTQESSFVSQIYPEDVVQTQWNLIWIYVR